jgi:hypothetical protein
MKKIVLALLLTVSYAGGKEKDAPSWVTEVATRALPAYSGKVAGAVLLDEQKVTVDANGMVDTVTRHAVKILTHQGKRLAEVTEGYEKGGRQVKDLHAWIVAPNGFVKTFEKSSVEDLGAYSDELYNDYRLRRIKSDNAEIGAVFVYETEVSEKAMEAQDRFDFQSDLPSLEAKYSITVPAGWTVSGTVLNHAPVAPRGGRRRSAFVWHNSDAGGGFPGTGRCRRASEFQSVERCFAVVWRDFSSAGRDYS